MRRRVIFKGKKKYLTRVVCIVMGGYMRDEGNGCVPDVNSGFDSFMRGVKGRVCLRHD